MDFIVKTLLGFFPRTWLISASQSLVPILDFLFRGNKLIDPINGKSYSRFLPYGYSKHRQNALSPGTLSLERHRVFWLFLQRQTRFFDDKLSVLHVAPEQCFYPLFREMKNLDYTTTDLSSPLADVKADLTNLPFEDNTFDVIFCNHVLEHIVEDKKAMSEMYRVLKKGGWGIFQVPLFQTKNTYEDFSITKATDRKKHFGQYDHVRLYGIDFYDRLKSVGFETTNFAMTETLSEEEIEKFAVEKGEFIPFVKKI